MNLRANLILIVLGAWNRLVVKPFYRLLRFLGWPERQPGAGDDGSPE